MEWVNKIHPIVRWVLFIPSFIAAYYLAYLILAWTLISYVGPKDGGVINTIIYWLQQDVIAMLAAFYVSTKMAPKGRMIIASIYVVLALILVGVNLALFLTGAATIGLSVILATIGTPITAGANLYIFIKERIEIAH